MRKKRKRIRLTERIVEEAGYRVAYTPAKDETTDRPRLQQLREGQKIDMRPKARRRQGLSEAGLIALMQDRGVGRPATYAETLAALRRHDYVRLQDGLLRLTPRGQSALTWLQSQYPTLFAVDFSRQLEGWLDDIAAGKREYAAVVGAVWRLLNQEKDEQGNAGS